MARIRIFIVLVIALSAGGVFAYATYRFVQQPAAAASMKTQSVVVAAADLPLGKELKPEDVRMVQFPEGSGPDGDASRARRHIAGTASSHRSCRTKPIFAKLRRRKPAWPRHHHSPGMRRCRCVNDRRRGRLRLPGTRVDVVATVNPTQKPDVTSKVVLANVQVPRRHQDRAGRREGQAMEVSVVTLLVDPE
jgi:Flp pilus assembly protein CpaB